MTKRMFTLSILAGIAVAAGVLASPAYVQGATKQGAGNRAQVENWCVVLEGDEFKAIRFNDMTQEKKRLADQYKSDMKKWKADKVNDPDAPRPHKLTPKLKKQNLSSQEEARAYCKKLQDELDEKNEGKDSKDTKTDKSTTASKGGS